MKKILFSKKDKDIIFIESCSFKRIAISDIINEKSNFLFGLKLNLSSNKPKKNNQELKLKLKLFQ